MTEEYIDEREEDFLDYFRNNLTDPASRGTNIVEELHTATGAAQTDFILNNTLVKNVADTILVNDVIKYKGFDYTVNYGEGATSTTVILKTGVAIGIEVKISYHHGAGWIVREFARGDATIPRIIISFLTGSKEYAALGDRIEDSKGIYFNASYRIEIRAPYASQARRLCSQAANIPDKIRHANLFRTNFAITSDMQNFDFDPDKDCYIWQFSVDVQWEILFE